MNTRAVLFLVVMFPFIAQSISAQTTTPEKPITPNQRGPGRADRSERRKKRRLLKEEKRKHIPPRRFDDGKRGSVHYTFQHMGYQELEENKQRLIQEKNYDAAIEYAKQQIAIATDAQTDITPDVLLEMADILYVKQDYEKAWKAYAQWVVQYPNAQKEIASEIQKTQHALGPEIVQALSMVPTSEVNESELMACKQSEYAAFRAVDAAYRCTQDPDRDQTQTHATIELADKFLQNSAQFKAHRPLVQSIRTACYEKLIKSELSICTFYRIQGNHEVAQNRLAMLEEEYAAQFPQSKNRIVAYRAAHYGTPNTATTDAPATLITENRAVPSTHAADRF